MTDRRPTPRHLRTLLGIGLHEAVKLLKGQALRDRLAAATSLDEVKAIVGELITDAFGDDPLLTNPPRAYEGEIKRGMMFTLFRHSGRPHKAEITRVVSTDCRWCVFHLYMGDGTYSEDRLPEVEFRILADRDDFQD